MTHGRLTRIQRLFGAETCSTPVLNRMRPAPAGRGAASLFARSLHTAKHTEQTDGWGRSVVGVPSPPLPPGEGCFVVLLPCGRGVVLAPGRLGEGPPRGPRGGGRGPTVGGRGGRASVVGSAGGGERSGEAQRGGSGRKPRRGPPSPSFHLTSSLPPAALNPLPLSPRPSLPSSRGPSPPRVRASVPTPACCVCCALCARLFCPSFDGVLATATKICTGGRSGRGRPRPAPRSPASALRADALPVVLFCLAFVSPRSVRSFAPGSRWWWCLLRGGHHGRVVWMCVGVLCCVAWCDHSNKTERPQQKERREGDAHRKGTRHERTNETRIHTTHTPHRGGGGL